MGSTQIKISPSILSADFGRLGEQIAEVERLGTVDRIHVDVMDGHFVPNITIGPIVVQAIRPRTKLKLEVHLMIESPGAFVESFIDAGADILVVHFEACPHLHREIEVIKQRGTKAGVAINPATPLASIGEIADYVDQVLLMTVNPGFGGQRFIEGVLPKIRQMRDLARERNLAAEIAVDGGINAANAPKAVAAGAQVLVTGSAVFFHPQGIELAIQEILGSVAQ
ncbi:MAG: ribulose-phosphate 3-epimerase [Chloroflexi bacterium]|nr:ribulose-phosphate 3-epimerase [Chloroflexota bacterium]